MTIDIEAIRKRAEKAFPLVVHIEDAAAARSCGRLLDYKRANQLVEWCQQDGQRIVDLVKCDIPALLTALAERDATIRELREALAVYVHAFDTDNAVPPFIVAKARAALAKGA